MKRGSVGSARIYHDSVLHSAVLFKLFNDLSDSRLFLSDRYINTNNVLTFLVDDGVYRDGSFTCLAVADDELALSAADRH